MFNKKLIILFVISIFIFFNLWIVTCVSESELIRLDVNEDINRTLNVTETQAHHYWIYLEYNETYSIEVDPSWNSSDADMYFNFNSSYGLIHFVDKVGMGKTEKYDFTCNRSGKYYIEVFSDKSAHYKIIVRKEMPFSLEICLTLMFLFVIYLVIAALFEKDKKKKEKIEEPIVEDTWSSRFLNSEIGRWLIILGIIASIIGLVIGAICLFFYFGWLP